MNIKSGLFVLICFFNCYKSVYCQPSKPFHYRVSDSITFLNASGNPYSKAMSGGFNAPQFSPCDVNGDSKKDLVVYDRIDGSITTFINKGGVGEVKYELDNRYAGYFPKVDANKWFLMRDFNNDGYEDIFTTTGIVITVYKNVSYKVNGRPAFEALPSLLYRNENPNGSAIEYNLLSTPFIHVPGIYDIDFDGDLDIMSYSNQGGAIQLFKNMQVEKGLPPDSIRYMFVDMCWAEFQDNNCNTFILNTCKDTVQNKFYWKRHTNGSSIVLFDADNDKDIDMVIGNEGCDHMTMLYNGKKDYHCLYDTIVAYDTNFVTSGNRARVVLYPAGYFLDIDNDGKRDFVMAPNSNSYAIQDTRQVYWFKNNGADLAPVFGQKQILFDNELFDVGNTSSWACADWDKDGDVDCLCANNADSAYKGGLNDRVYLFENTGNTQNPVFKLRNRDFGAFLSQNITSLTLSAADMNNDGKLDLVTGNDRGEIKYYKNTSATSNTLSPTFALSNGAFPGFNIDVGFYSYPAAADIDKDGLFDLVIGYSDTFLKYYRNTGTKTVPDFNFVTAHFGMISSRDSVDFEYIHVTEYDTLGNVIKDTIVGIKVFMEKNLFTSPQVRDINGDSVLELLVGNSLGYLKLYEINSVDANAKFIKCKDFYYYNLLPGEKMTDFDLGNRISPAFANLTGDAAPEIIVGINRGGVNYLKPDFKYKSIGLNKIFIPELVSIYPNPAMDYTMVDMGFDEIKYVKLITISGQVFMPVYKQEGSKVVLTTSNLGSGVYFLNIETTNGKVKVARLEILR